MTLDVYWAEQVPGSPLVGLGAAFVREGERNGIDPRALAAIAMHESVLGTAGSGANIHNAFGWGPAIAFPSWEANIATVARGLAQGYIARGRDTLAAIQPVWDVMGIFPDERAILRLVGAVLIEAHDEWAIAERRYLSEGSMAAILAAGTPPALDAPAPALLAS